jgi:transcriptional regulator with XRE-family HTH domain
MSKAEVQICARVKQFREAGELSQSLFAEALNITRDKLASIEYGRTPLRFWVGRALCRQFNVSQAWLAEGLGNPQPKIEFAEEVERSIPPKTLFSRAFAEYLLPKLSIVQGGLIKRPVESISIQFLTPAGLAEDEHLGWILKRELGAIMDDLPRELRIPFAKSVVAAVARFGEMHGMGGRIRSLVRLFVQTYGSVPGEEKEGLTKIIEFGNNAGVKQIWDAFLKRLNDATAEHGMKSRLAKFMGVPLPNVSQWLSGDREPSGETTLRLLQWVEQEERKVKSPGSAVTPSGPKTRLKEVYDKTKKPSPSAR